MQSKQSMPSYESVNGQLPHIRYSSIENNSATRSPNAQYEAYNDQQSQQSQKLSAMLKKIDVAINKDEGGIIPTKRSPEAIAASYRSAAEIKQTPEIKKRVPAALEDNINQNVHEFRKNANRK